MPLIQQDDLVDRKKNPFNNYICDNCGSRLGSHWLFSPEKLRDVFPLAITTGRKPNGKLYCSRSQTAFAGSYHQRTLKRTMAPGFREEYGAV